MMGRPLLAQGLKDKGKDWLNRSILYNRKKYVEPPGMVRATSGLSLNAL